MKEPSLAATRGEERQPPNSDGQTEQCDGSQISKEKLHDKPESISESKSAAQVPEKEATVLDSRPSSVEGAAVAMPTSMSDDAPADKKSSIDGTMQTVERQPSARIQ